jgi:DNA-3-methyladenine glycosylase
MFGPPGVAYVYLIYGMHNCLNVVTELAGYPAAVLIRALEPGRGVELPTNGPGRLCRALAIDRSYNGRDLVHGPLRSERRDSALSPDRIEVGPRVGVDYAGDWAARPWRFMVIGSPSISVRPRRATP